MKKGDLVVDAFLLKKDYPRYKCEGVIIKTGGHYNRFKVKFFNRFNTSGDNVKSWVPEHCLELDTKKLRNSKLDDILD